MANAAQVVAAVREESAQGRRREAAAGGVLAEGRGDRRQSHPNQVSAWPGLGSSCCLCANSTILCVYVVRIELLDLYPLLFYGTHDIPPEA